MLFHCSRYLYSTIYQTSGWENKVIAIQSWWTIYTPSCRSVPSRCRRGRLEGLIYFFRLRANCLSSLPIWGPGPSSVESITTVNNFFEWGWNGPWERKKTKIEYQIEYYSYRLRATISHDLILLRLNLVLFSIYSCNRAFQRSVPYFYLVRIT